MSLFKKNHPRLDRGQASQNSGPDAGEFPMLRIPSKGLSFAEARGTTLIGNSWHREERGESFVLTWLFVSFCAKTKGKKTTVEGVLYIQYRYALLSLNVKNKC